MLGIHFAEPNFFRAKISSCKRNRRTNVHVGPRAKI